MEGIAGVLMFVLMLALYFVPTGVAYYKEKTNILAIFLTNLLLGWTFIGWILALIWAATEDNS